MIQPPFRWQLAQAELDPVVGSEQAGVRPALIISREVANHVLSIVTVLPLTRYRGDRPIYPSEVLLPAGSAGQPLDSLVMAHQIRTLAKSRFVSSYGWLTDQELRDAVLTALRIHLDMP